MDEGAGTSSGLDDTGEFMLANSGYSFGRLIAELPMTSGRLCVYRFDFWREAQMTQILPVNFTISEEAFAEAERIKMFYNATADDPFDVLTIAWGIYKMKDGRSFENVIVSFYPRSYRLDIEAAIQHLMGVPLVFFITEEFYERFSGKVVDFKSEKGFFLR